MVVLGGEAVSYERGTPVNESQRERTEMSHGVWCTGTGNWNATISEFQELGSGSAVWCLQDSHD